MNKEKSGSAFSFFRPGPITEDELHITRYNARGVIHVFVYWGTLENGTLDQDVGFISFTESSFHKTTTYDDGQ